MIRDHRDPPFFPSPPLSGPRGGGPARHEARGGAGEQRLNVHGKDSLPRGTAMRPEGIDVQVHEHTAAAKQPPGPLLVSLTQEGGPRGVAVLRTHEEIVVLEGPESRAAIDRLERPETPHDDHG